MQETDTKMFLNLPQELSQLTGASSLRQSNMPNRLRDISIGVHLLFTIALSLITCQQVPKVEISQQPVSSMQPSFLHNMDLITVKENTPIGDIIYTLEAKVDRMPQVKILYGIEGTQLFSVNKTSGQVKVAQLIDREQTSDSITLDRKSVV